MSNTFKVGHSATSPKFRVYIQAEPGAKLVRHGKPTTSLQKALKTVAQYAPAIAWEIRLFWNGIEKLVHTEEIQL